jgi:hypothetical protein
MEVKEEPTPMRTAAGMYGSGKEIKYPFAIGGKDLATEPEG